MGNLYVYVYAPQEIHQEKRVGGGEETELATEIPLAYLRLGFPKSKSRVHKA